MDIARYRMVGNEEEPVNRLETIRKNLKAWMNVQDDGIITWSKVAMLIILVALVLMIWRKLKDLKTIGAYAPMLIIAGYPYIWYMVLANHCQVHFWFTYRAQLVTLFGLLLFIVSILKRPSEQGEECKMTGQT